MNNQLKTTQILLEAKSEINTRSKSGATPLYMAAERDNIILVKCLVQYGANIDENSRKDRVNALSRAAYRGCMNIVEFLIKHKADITTKRGGKTAAEWALHAGHINIHDEIIRLSIKSMININNPSSIEKEKQGIITGCKNVENSLNICEMVLNCDFFRIIHERFNRHIEESTKRRKTNNDKLFDTQMKGIEEYCEHLVKMNRTSKKLIYNFGEVAREISTIKDRDVKNIASIIGIGIQSEIFRVNVNIIINVDINETNNSEYYAFKKIRLNDQKNNENNLVKEITILSKLPPHPNIIRLHAIVTEGSKKNGFLMDYYSLGSLDRQKVRFHQNNLLIGIRGIARAILHLHSYGVIHMDLSSRNIMLKYDGTFILTDFGMSEIYPYYLRENLRLPWRTLAPEILRERKEYFSSNI